MAQNDTKLGRQIIFLYKGYLQKGKVTFKTKASALAQQEMSIRGKTH